MIELVTFSLRDGHAGLDAFLAADARVQTEFAYLRPGLVRRTTARSDDGRWLVLTLWGSAEEADATAVAAGSHPSVAEFEAFVDQATKQIDRFSALEG